MRSIIKILLLAAYIATSCMTQAQNNRQQLTREQLAEVQAKHIAKETGMDDATSKRFINTYCDFQKEIWALNPKKEYSIATWMKKRQDKPYKTDSSTAKRFST